MGALVQVRQLLRIARYVFALLVLLIAQTSLAQTRALIVLYPDVPQPERDVFALMRVGIQTEAARAGFSVNAIGIAENASAMDYSTRLRTQSPRAVIALGRRSYQMVSAMKLDAPIVIGAVDLPADAAASGISLTPDPRLVLSTLRSVAPQIQRVIVVTDPKSDQWLLKPAAAAARADGLQLQVYSASSVGEAAAHYLNVFRYGNPLTDAIWILKDGNFINSDTLPRIIEESWSRNFVVFSNVLAHVSKGALFAHYPDPRLLGERLTRLALSKDEVQQIQFLKDLKRAANVRVAAHLGPAVNSAQLATFDVVLGRE